MYVKIICAKVIGSKKEKEVSAAKACLKIISAIFKHAAGQTLPFLFEYFTIITFSMTLRIPSTVTILF